MKKFISWNSPNLHFIEDPYFHRATRWEQDDALRCLQNTILRIYTLSMRRADDPIYYNGKNLAAAPTGKTTTEPSFQRHVYGPGLVDLELLDDLDSLVELCKRYNITLIIPIVDEWTWWGGYEQMAAWRGLPKADFYSSPVLIQDYKDIVTLLVSRYANNDIIWETGNELGITADEPIPSSWTMSVAAHFKSLSNQTVIDGSCPMKWKWTDEVLSNPNVDGFTQHYYESLGRPIPVGFYIGMALGLLGMLAGIVLAVVFYKRRCVETPKHDDEDRIISPVLEPGEFNVSPAQEEEPLSCTDVVKSLPNSSKYSALAALLSTLVCLTFLILILVYLYTSNTTLMLEDAQLATKYPGKLFYVGEVGLMSVNQASTLLQSIIDSPLITGALYWSLRFHTNNTGFYTHREKSPWQSHHYPGLSPSNPYEGYPDDDLQLVTLVRKFSALAAGQANATLARPFAPSGFHVDPKSDSVGLYWRGGCPARFYTLQRCVATNCTTIATRVMETVGWNEPVYYDTNVGPGSFYRVRGENEAGSSEWLVSDPI